MMGRIQVSGQPLKEGRRPTAVRAACRRYTVAGLVLLRQRPSSARGVTFLTLEDETATVNLIVRQHVWDKYHRVAGTAAAMFVSGHLQREAGVIHLLVERLEDLTAHLAEINSRSRDFR